MTRSHPLLKTLRNHFRRQRLNLCWTALALRLLELLGDLGVGPQDLVKARGAEVLRVLLAQRWIRERHLYGGWILMTAAADHMDRSSAGMVSSRALFGPAIRPM